MCGSRTLDFVSWELGLCTKEAGSKSVPLDRRNCQKLLTTPLQWGGHSVNGDEVIACEHAHVIRV